MLLELEKLIENNPLFRDKLQFPNLKASRLRTLINQEVRTQLSVWVLAVYAPIQYSTLDCQWV